jgi:hypothetical protein
MPLQQLLNSNCNISDWQAMLHTMLVGPGCRGFDIVLQL